MRYKNIQFIAQGKTNLVYVLIVVILAAIVGGVILTYSILEFPELTMKNGKNIIESPPQNQQADECNKDYPEDHFRACYFDGEGFSGLFLGSIDEHLLGLPVSEIGYGIDHDWKKEIFNGQRDNISASWQGYLNFSPGKYHIVIEAGDGFRFYLNEDLLLDTWGEGFGAFGEDFILPVELSGYNKIRVEWYNKVGPSRLRIHWEKSPAVKDIIVSPIRIDFYMLTQVNTCIVGSPCKEESPSSGNCVRIYNKNFSIYKAFQIDNNLKALRPSDPTIKSYPQSLCLSLTISPEDQIKLENEAKDFAETIRQWSFGAISPNLNIFPVAGETTMRRHLNTETWMVSSSDIKPLIEDKLTSDTDFIIITQPLTDIGAGLRIRNAKSCGTTYYAPPSLGGATYAWIPKVSFPQEPELCSGSGLYLHEWSHQLDWALHNLMGIQDRYNNFFPGCGLGDNDTYSWYPNPDRVVSDPDFPWCGADDDPGDEARISHSLLKHYDPSMTHYKYPKLFGNHCRNGIRDFDETKIDKGGSCPN